MALFQRWKDLRRPTVVYVNGGDVGVSIANMDAAALYRTQPNLRAVVSFLADNAAQIPLKVHDRAGDNDRPRVTDSAAALLLKQPNPDLTAFEFKRWLYSDLLLYERHISIIAPSADTPSGWELRPIPGSWVQQYKGSSPFAPESVIVGVPGTTPIEVPAERFVLFHGYDPTDPMRQYSRIAALRETLHEQVESNAFRRQMWRRGGRFNMYLTRPKDVEKWTNEAFDRFKESWKASWAGSDAGEGGGTPILEDGMEIKNVLFNSRDAQWAESVKLSREDCAAVYHVNPALIWPESGQTYASAKDNARALYNDTLAPLLMQATDRINQDLLARIGEPSTHYVVYDIAIKTQGTFEERVSAGQTACGVPFMTINEVRGEFNLPAVPGGDDIVQPLNMLYGGLASTHDTDPTRERYNAAPAEKSVAIAAESPRDATDTRRKARGEPSDDADAKLAEAYRAFFERQAKSVIPKMAAKSDAWWNAERWNRELADDLEAVAMDVSTLAGEETVRALWPEKAEHAYDADRTRAYVRSMCERRAEMVNAATYDELSAIEDGEWDEDSDALKSTPEGVFENAEENRSETAGKAFAAALVSWAVLEGVRQNRRGENVYKTWVARSGNPRTSHARLNGETVQYDKPFSNGADWPGDIDHLDVSEVANCRCVLEVTIED
jgi:HK97 family phage portal protein